MAAFWFVWRNRRLNWELLVNCFVQSAKTTCMVVLMIVCALLFNVTSSMTGGTQAVTRWVIGLSTALLLLFVVFHAIMGMFMGAMSMLVVTYR